MINHVGRMGSTSDAVVPWDFEITVGNDGTDRGYLAATFGTLLEGNVNGATLTGFYVDNAPTATIRLTSSVDIDGTNDISVYFGGSFWYLSRTGTGAYETTTGAASLNFLMFLGNGTDQIGTVVSY